MSQLLLYNSEKLSRYEQVAIASSAENPASLVAAVDSDKIISIWETMNPRCPKHQIAIDVPNNAHIVHLDIKGEYLVAGSRAGEIFLFHRTTEHEWARVNTDDLNGLGTLSKLHLESTGSQETLVFAISQDEIYYFRAGRPAEAQKSTPFGDKKVDRVKLVVDADQQLWLMAASIYADYKTDESFGSDSDGPNEDEEFEAPKVMLISRARWCDDLSQEMEWERVEVDEQLSSVICDAREIVEISRDGTILLTSELGIVDGHRGKALVPEIPALDDYQRWGPFALLQCHDRLLLCTFDYHLGRLSLGHLTMNDEGWSVDRAVRTTNVEETSMRPFENVLATCDAGFAVIWNTMDKRDVKSAICLYRDLTGPVKGWVSSAEATKKSRGYFVPEESQHPPSMKIWTDPRNDRFPTGGVICIDKNASLGRPDYNSKCYRFADGEVTFVVFRYNERYYWCVKNEEMICFTNLNTTGIGLYPEYCCIVFMLDTGDGWARSRLLRFVDQITVQGFSKTLWYFFKDQCLNYLQAS